MGLKAPRCQSTCMFTNLFVQQFDDDSRQQQTAQPEPNVQGNEFDEADLKWHRLEGNYDVAKKSTSVSAIDFNIQAGLALLNNHTRADWCPFWSLRTFANVL